MVNVAVLCLSVPSPAPGFSNRVLALSTVVFPSSSVPAALPPAKRTVTTSGREGGGDTFSAPSTEVSTLATARVSATRGAMEMLTLPAGAWATCSLLPFPGTVTE